MELPPWLKKVIPVGIQNMGPGAELAFIGLVSAIFIGIIVTISVLSIKSSAETGHGVITYPNAPCSSDIDCTRMVIKERENSILGPITETEASKLMFCNDNTGTCVPSGTDAPHACDPTRDVCPGTPPGNRCNDSPACCGNDLEPFYVDQDGNVTENNGTEPSSSVVCCPYNSTYANGHCCPNKIGTALSAWCGNQCCMDGQSCLTRGDGAKLCCADGLTCHSTSLDRDGNPIDSVCCEEGTMCYTDENGAPKCCPKNAACAPVGKPEIPSDFSCKKISSDGADFSTSAKIIIRLVENVTTPLMISIKSSTGAFTSPEKFITGDSQTLVANQDITTTKSVSGLLDKIRFVCNSRVKLGYLNVNGTVLYQLATKITNGVSTFMSPEDAIVFGGINSLCSGNASNGRVSGGARGSCKLYNDDGIVENYIALKKDTGYVEWSSGVSCAKNNNESNAYSVAYPGYQEDFRQYCVPTSEIINMIINLDGYENTVAGSWSHVIINNGNSTLAAAQDICNKIPELTGFIISNPNTKTNPNSNTPPTPDDYKTHCSFFTGREWINMANYPIDNSLYRSGGWTTYQKIVPSSDDYVLVKYLGKFNQPNSFGFITGLNHELAQTVIDEYLPGGTLINPWSTDTYGVDLEGTTNRTIETLQLLCEKLEEELLIKCGGFNLSAETLIPISSEKIMPLSIEDPSYKNYSSYIKSSLISTKYGLPSCPELVPLCSGYKINTLGSCGPMSSAKEPTINGTPFLESISTPESCEKSCDAENGDASGDDASGDTCIGYKYDDTGGTLKLQPTGSMSPSECQYWCERSDFGQGIVLQGGSELSNWTKIEKGYCDGSLSYINLSEDQCKEKCASDTNCSYFAWNKDTCKLKWQSSSCTTVTDIDWDLYQKDMVEATKTPDSTTCKKVCMATLGCDGWEWDEDTSDCTLKQNITGYTWGSDLKKYAGPKDPSDTETNCVLWENNENNPNSCVLYGGDSTLESSNEENVTAGRATDIVSGMNCRSYEFEYSTKNVAVVSLTLPEVENSYPSDTEIQVGFGLYNIVYESFFNTSNVETGDTIVKSFTLSSQNPAQLTIKSRNDSGYIEGGSIYDCVTKPTCPQTHPYIDSLCMEKLVGCGAEEESQLCYRVPGNDWENTDIQGEGGVWRCNQPDGEGWNFDCGGTWNCDGDFCGWYGGSAKGGNCNIDCEGPYYPTYASKELCETACLANENCNTCVGNGEVWKESTYSKDQFTSDCKNTNVSKISELCKEMGMVSKNMNGCNAYANGINMTEYGTDDPLTSEISDSCLLTDCVDASKKLFGEVNTSPVLSEIGTWENKPPGCSLKNDLITDQFGEISGTWTVYYNKNSAGVDTDGVFTPVEVTDTPCMDDNAVNNPCKLHNCNGISRNYTNFDIGECHSFCEDTYSKFTTSADINSCKDGCDLMESLVYGTSLSFVKETPTTGIADIDTQENVFRYPDSFIYIYKQDGKWVMSRIYNGSVTYNGGGPYFQSSTDEGNIPPSMSGINGFETLSTTTTDASPNIFITINDSTFESCNPMVQVSYKSSTCDSSTRCCKNANCLPDEGSETTEPATEAGEAAAEADTPEPFVISPNECANTCVSWYGDIALDCDNIYSKSACEANTKCRSIPGAGGQLGISSLSINDVSLIDSDAPVEWLYPKKDYTIPESGRNQEKQKCHIQIKTADSIGSGIAGSVLAKFLLTDQSWSNEYVLSPGIEKGGNSSILIELPDRPQKIWIYIREGFRWNMTYLKINGKEIYNAGVSDLGYSFANPGIGDCSCEAQQVCESSNTDGSDKTIKAMKIDCNEGECNNSLDGSWVDKCNGPTDYTCCVEAYEDTDCPQRTENASTGNETGGCNSTSSLENNVCICKDGSNIINTGVCENCNCPNIPGYIGRGNCSEAKFGPYGGLSTDIPPGYTNVLSKDECENIATQAGIEFVSYPNPDIFSRPWGCYTISDGNTSTISFNGSGQPENNELEARVIFAPMNGITHTTAPISYGYKSCNDCQKACDEDPECKSISMDEYNNCLGYKFESVNTSGGTTGASYNLSSGAEVTISDIPIEYSSFLAPNERINAIGNKGPKFEGEDAVEWGTNGGEVTNGWKCTKRGDIVGEPGRHGYKGSKMYQLGSVEGVTSKSCAEMCDQNPECGGYATGGDQSDPILKECILYKYGSPEVPTTTDSDKEWQYCYLPVTDADNGYKRCEKLCSRLNGCGSNSKTGCPGAVWDIPGNAQMFNPADMTIWTDYDQLNEAWKGTGCRYDLVNSPSLISELITGTPGSKGDWKAQDAYDLMFEKCKNALIPDTPFHERVQVLGNPCSDGTSCTCCAGVMDTLYLPGDVEEDVWRGQSCVNGMCQNVCKYGPSPDSQEIVTCTENPNVICEGITDSDTCNSNDECLWDADKKNCEGPFPLTCLDIDSARESICVPTTLDTCMIFAESEAVLPIKVAVEDNGQINTGQGKWQMARGGTDFNTTTSEYDKVWWKTPTDVAGTTNVTSNISRAFKWSKEPECGLVKNDRVAKAQLCIRKLATGDSTIGYEYSDALEVGDDLDAACNAEINMDKTLSFKLQNKNQVLPQDPTKNPIKSLTGDGDGRVNSIACKYTDNGWQDVDGTPLTASNLGSRKCLLPGGYKTDKAELEAPLYIKLLQDGRYCEYGTCDGNTCRDVNTTSWGDCLCQFGGRTTDPDPTSALQRDLAGTEPSLWFRPKKTEWWDGTNCKKVSNDGLYCPNTVSGKLVYGQYCEKLHDINIICTGHVDVDKSVKKINECDLQPELCESNYCVCKDGAFNDSPNNCKPYNTCEYTGKGEMCGGMDWTYLSNPKYFPNETNPEFPGYQGLGTPSVKLVSRLIEDRADNTIRLSTPGQRNDGDVHGFCDTKTNTCKCTDYYNCSNKNRDCTAACPIGGDNAYDCDYKDNDHGCRLVSSMPGRSTYCDYYTLWSCKGKSGEEWQSKACYAQSGAYNLGKYHTGDNGNFSTYCNGPEGAYPDDGRWSPP